MPSVLVRRAQKGQFHRTSIALPILLVDFWLTSLPLSAVRPPHRIGALPETCIGQADLNKAKQAR